MNLKTLSSEGKIAYLIKPILKVLQEAGGQLERSEIKERIADMDDQNVLGQSWQFVIKRYYYISCYVFCHSIRELRH